MAQLIITSKQAKYLNEDTTTLQFATDNNDASGALSRGDTQSQIQNAQTTFGGNITAQFTPQDGPGETTITVPNTKSGINGAGEALKDNSQEVQKALSNGMNVGVDVSEGAKIFSKKFVEEARLERMRKNGRSMTKKQLSESFLEPDIADKLNNMGLFDVLSAYEECLGGNPQDLATVRDMTSAVVEKYNNSSEEQKALFRERLHI